MERENLNDDKSIQEKEDGSGAVRISKEPDNEQQVDSVNSVFNNPLLMDNIVKYSIYTTNGKRINKQTLVAARLVNKTFLRSASRVLKICGDWIMELKIGSGCIMRVNRITRERTYDEPQEIILDKFISVFSKSARSTDSVLSISFIIEQLYLTTENSENLRNVLLNFGDIISALSVNYPLDGGLLKFNCNSLNFPILRSFKFKFETWRDQDTNQAKDAQSEDNENGLEFLQHILQNSKKLQHFTLTVSYNKIINIGLFSLPQTVKGLTLELPLNDNIKALLSQTQLSNLNTLDVIVGKQEDVSLVYNILERFSKQLTNLFLDCNSIYLHEYDPDDESRFCIKVPLMEKLKSLKVSGENHDLSPDINNKCSKFLPNLSQLILVQHTEAMFLDWAQGSRFENVKKLKLALHSDKEEFPNDMSPNVRIVKEIITSFPNIEKLSLKVLLDEIGGLKYVFQHLTCLKKLRLDFDTDGVGKKPGKNLVSLLLGISLERAAAIVDGTERNVTVDVDNPKSIMNLKELTSLTLWTPYVRELERKRDLFCSRIISQYGLSKMPKLAKIKFLGGFKFAL